MTTHEVFRMREKIGFITPLSPVSLGNPLLLSAREDWYELAMHPDDAMHAIAFGLVINDRRYFCTVVDCLPFMNAFLIQTQPPDGLVSEKQFERSDIGEAHEYRLERVE